MTHGLMWKENILNLSYPSETVPCGFQKHEGTSSLKRGRGSEEKSVERVGKMGEVGRTPVPTHLGLAWEGQCLPTSVGQFLPDPGSLPLLPSLDPLLRAHFLQHQQQVSIFIQTPQCSSLHPPK